MTDNPFQTMREVDDYLSGDAIVCLMCGKSFQRLNSHLQRIHQVEADDYRRRFGIPFNRSLTSEPSRVKSGAAMTPEGIEQFKRMIAARDPDWRPVRRNTVSVPAVANQWREIVSKSKTWDFARKRVTVPCPKCGCGVTTSAFRATRPVFCMKCTSPDSRNPVHTIGAGNWRLD